MHELIVACVNVGKKYPPVFVDRLYSMVRRHLGYQYEFVCITDAPRNYEDLPIRVVAPEKSWPGWWAKFNLFSEACIPAGPHVLFFDLDLVILNSINCFIDCTVDTMTPPPILRMLQNFPSGIGHAPHNSSIMAWRQGEANRVIWKKFTPDWINRTHGDQEVISQLADEVTEWPTDWALSYKCHFKGRNIVPPPECRVVVFHGEFGPGDVPEQWAHDAWT